MESATRGTENMLVPDPVIQKSVLGMILIVLMDTVCVTGNLVLAVSYIKNPPPDNRIKSILSIVLASLCIGLLHIPISLTLIADPDLFEGVMWLCRVASWIQNYCALNFLTNMDLVTICTYVTIAYPLRSPSWLTDRNYNIGLTLVWLTPAVIATIPVAVHADIETVTHCVHMAHRFSFPATMVLIFGFFLPSLTFHLALQARIFYIARQQAKEIAKAQYINLDMKETHQQRKKGFKVMAVYVSAFLIVWVPLSILLLVESFCPDCLSDTLALTLLSLGITAAATLPLIFSAVNTLNRTSVKKTFSVIWQPKDTQLV